MAVDKVLETLPVGRRIFSAEGGWVVQSLSLEQKGGKRVVHVSFGVADRKCAGHGADDGPYLDIILLNARGQPIYEISHIASLMVPDAQSVPARDFDVTEKVSQAYVDRASFISASMKADGVCR